MIMPADNDLFNEYMYRSRCGSFDVSAKKTTINVGQSTLPRYCELTGVFIDRNKLALGVGQSANTLKFNEETMGAGLLSMNGGAVEICQKGGAVAGMVAIEVATMSKNHAYKITSTDTRRGKYLETLGWWGESPLHSNCRINEFNTLSMNPYYAHGARTGRMGMLDRMNSWAEDVSEQKEKWGITDVRADRVGPFSIPVRTSDKYDKTD